MHQPASGSHPTPTHPPSYPCGPEHSDTDGWGCLDNPSGFLCLFFKLSHHVVADEAPPRSQPATGAQRQLGSPWKPRVQRLAGSGLFTPPFWQASSATLKPIHRAGEPGASPPTPPPCPAVPLREFGLTSLFPSGLLPSHPPFWRPSQSAGRGEPGLGRARFSILSRFPLHRQ